MTLLRFSPLTSSRPKDGKISVTNNFYQYGIRFTDTSSHTLDVDGDAFREDLRRFAAVCRTVRGLRSARIGAIGARTSPFHTMRYSEKLLQASGMTVVTVDLRIVAPNSVKSKASPAHNYPEGVRFAALMAIMAAKKKPLVEVKLAELTSDTTLKIKYTSFEMPPARKAGVKVKTVAELVTKLKTEAKVL